jgi:hypothetical protein
MGGSMIVVSCFCRKTISVSRRPALPPTRRVVSKFRHAWSYDVQDREPEQAYLAVSWKITAGEIRLDGEILLSAPHASQGWTQIFFGDGQDDGKQTSEASERIDNPRCLEADMGHTPMYKLVPGPGWAAALQRWRRKFFNLKAVGFVTLSPVFYM